MRLRGLFLFPVLLSLFSQLSSADVLKVVLDDTIQAETAERVERAIDRASEQKYEAVLIELNTPGGMMGSMHGG
jgi:membrane-bound ClpP family serine protease